MTPLAALLRERIRREGPIRFREFMSTALYHAGHGYYRRGRDPFGKHGDFYTAEQVQPVFGNLIAGRVRALYREMGSPSEFTVVELGAGRGEMAAALSEWRYLPVEIGGALPERFCGVVFANEFFDALPVDVAICAGGLFLSRKVGIEGERFGWITAEPIDAEDEVYLRRYFPPPEEGRIFEIHREALGWVERIAQALDSGYLMIIDYGYTREEWRRFPRGSLMSYRRHTAREDVLETPGEIDITAHVPFTALQEHGAKHGLATESFRTLAQTLLEIGEADQFAAALAAATPEEEIRRRLQLKTLLFGMGETFRVLVQRKAGK